MAYSLARRDAAEAIEQFGDDLAKLSRSLDRLFERLPGDMVQRLNVIPHQDRIDSIAESFRQCGMGFSRDCDAAEDANTRCRANPLEPDFRRIA